MILIDVRLPGTAIGLLFAISAPRFHLFNQLEMLDLIYIGCILDCYLLLKMLREINDGEKLSIYV